MAAILRVIFWNTIFVADNYTILINFTEICFQWLNWRWFIIAIGSENGVAPKRQQVIIWINDAVEFTDASLGPDNKYSRHLGPFYQHGLTSISSWISNHMSNKVWDDISSPLPNSNGYFVEIWEWVSNFIPHFMVDAIT